MMMMMRRLCGETVTRSESEFRKQRVDGVTTRWREFLKNFVRCGNKLINYSFSFQCLST